MTPNDIVQLLAAAATAAHQAGYEQGHKAAEAATQTPEYIEMVRLAHSFADDLKEAHGQGYDAGFNDGADGRQDAEKAAYCDGYNDASTSAYDDGYVDGVSDARVCPSDADARVAELCSDEEYDDAWGEQRYDPFCTYSV